MLTTFDELVRIRESLSGTLVLAVGTFDILHEGHVEHLSYAKELGDLLVVGLVSDRRVRKRKGPSRPVRDELSRLLVIDALKTVDYCFIMPAVSGDKSPTIQVVGTIKPDIFVLNVENKGKYGDDLEEKLNKYGTKLIIENRPKLNSTSQLIQRIKQDLN